MEWILLILIYAGPIARGDSVALENVQGFATKQQCEAAGKELDPLVKGSTKNIRFVCLQRK